MRLARTALVAMLSLVALSLPAANAVVGKWKTDGGKSLVEITATPEGGLSGRIVWLKEPLYMDAKQGPVGSAKVDRHNQDVTLRGKPLLGLRILEGFVVAAEGLWEKGTIYDPENGKTYKCRMKLTAPDRLEVRGYIGISLIGRTTVWTR